MAATNYSFGQLKTRVINLEVQHNTLTSICMVMARRLKELERKVGGVPQPETKNLPQKEEVKKINMKKEKKKKIVYVEESDSESEEEVVRVVRNKKKEKPKKSVKNPPPLENDDSEDEVPVKSKSKPEPVVESESETSDSEAEEPKVVEKPAPKRRGRKPKNQTINILESADS